MTLTTRQDQDDRQDMIPTVMNIKIEEINKKINSTTRTIKMFDKNVKLQWNRAPVEEDYKSCISWMTD
jgi:hypothetical protein